MKAVPHPAQRPLLSVEEARGVIVLTTSPITGVEDAPLRAARGRVLARDLDSPLALPVFDHSAMDGYALALAPGVENYRLAGRIAAGATPRGPLRPGEALRVFTGAPLPAGADAVAMQENVALEGDWIRPLKPTPSGDNIRHSGEDVAKGDRLIESGAILDARHIGLAAAVGRASLPVLRQLRVALVSTGDELAEAGERLAAGQIYDSNRPMLAAAIERPAIELFDHGRLPDDRAAIARFFADAGHRFDLVVTTGGASVGDEDHLSAALAAANGVIDVARVAIRPGKPFTHGRVGDASVAILPGNPFAAFVAALLFVRPMIDGLLGLEPRPFRPLPARANFAQPRAGGRVEFMPARIETRGDDGLPVLARLGRGGSARIRPLIGADGLAVIAPGDEPLRVGDPIGFLPFGTAFSL